MRWFAVLIVAACGGTSAVTSSVAPPAQQQPPAPPQTLVLPDAGHFYHGVIPIGSYPSDFATDASQRALDDYEQAVGRKVAWVYFSHEWKDSRAFPADTVKWIRARGKVPFIRLMLRSQKEALAHEPTFTIPRILAGEFDDDLGAWAEAARDSGGPLIVEYGTEVNGDWNPWSAPYNGGLDKGPAQFIAAYRHIVALMRAHGATNITWALHYNVQSYPEDPRNVPMSYYPGDDVVDWVGVSAYGSERSVDHRCIPLRKLLDDMVPLLPPNKPQFLFEIGITSTNAACPPGPWLTDAFNDFLAGRWPMMRGFSWWQQKWNDDGKLGSDMQVQDDPGTTAALRAAAQNPAVLDAPLLR